MAVSNALITSANLSRVGLFPLPSVVLFPSQLLSLHVFEARYRRLVSDAIVNDLVLALPRLKPGHDAEYYGAPPIFQVCGVGKVSEYVRLPDGRYNIVVQGLGRVRLVEELRSSAYRMARAEPLPDTEPKLPLMADTLRAELAKLLQRAAPQLSSASDLRKRLDAATDPGVMADIVAGTLVEDPDDRQALLEERDPCRRMSWLIAHLHAASSKPASPSSSRSPERPN